MKLPGLRPGEKIFDYWEPGRIMLTDPQAFLVSLMEFDKDSITEEMIEKLKKYVEDPLFTPAKIAKVLELIFSDIHCSLSHHHHNL